MNNTRRKVSSRVVALGRASLLKEGEAGTEAQLRCSRLRQSYFQTTSPSRLLHLHLWWGKPHHCSGPSHRHDSRMDPLFTQAVRGTGARGWDVVVGHKRSLLLNLRHDGTTQLHTTRRGRMCECSPFSSFSNNARRGQIVYAFAHGP